MKLRVVLVKTPDGKNVAETFFSTDVSNYPKQIINWFVLRWNIEVTLEESRSRLGDETQRQWSYKAIQRTTPLLMGLYSLLTLVAFETKAILVHETTSWYDKNGELTFVGILVTDRQSIWSKKYLSKSRITYDSLKFTDQEANSLIYHLAMAA